MSSSRWLREAGPGSGTPTLKLTVAAAVRFTRSPDVPVEISVASSTELITAHLPDRTFHGTKRAGNDPWRFSVTAN